MINPRGSCPLLCHVCLGLSTSRHRCLSLIPRNLLVALFSWTRMTDDDVARVSSTSSMRERLANVSAAAGADPRRPGRAKPVCSVNDDDCEETLSCDELMGRIERCEQRRQDEGGDAVRGRARRRWSEGPFRLPDPAGRGGSSQVRHPRQVGERGDGT